jgi:hypothetical protein
MARLILALLATTAFLVTAVPFYLAPWSFYNSYSLLTTLMPLMFLLSGVLSVGGILYYIFQRKTEKRIEKQGWRLWPEPS